METLAAVARGFITDQDVVIDPHAYAAQCGVNGAGGTGATVPLVRRGDVGPVDVAGCPLPLVQRPRMALAGGVQQSRYHQRTPDFHRFIGFSTNRMVSIAKDIVAMA
jgi:hypothetical protein